MASGWVFYSTKGNAMAEVVTELPGVVKQPNFPHGTYAKYLDGQVWKLTLGVDCHKTARTALGALYNAASMKGLKIRVRNRGKAEGAIYVQSYREGE
jgi:hypothetical protein